eukprot:1513571-Pyramimonas_sp.AAC.1
MANRKKGKKNKKEVEASPVAPVEGETPEGGTRALETPTRRDLRFLGRTCWAAMRTTSGSPRGRPRRNP